MSRLGIWVCGALLAFGAPVGASAEEGQNEAAALQQPAAYFARINDHTISQEEFVAALREGARQRFYHGKAPEEELQAFQREVADELINRYLLAKEARARGIEPDQQDVEKKLARIEERNQNNPGWQQARETLLGKIRTHFEDLSLVERLESKVRAEPAPAGAEVRAYYQQNPDKFTTPVSNRVGVILLPVDPSAGGEAWEVARNLSLELLEQLKAGEAFSTLAELHSADPSAEQGGDMGFVHAGTLGESVESVVAEMELGAVSDPLMLLNGVALVKLLDRIDPQLQPFEAVEARAAGLLQREQAQLAWESLIFRLRQQADIDINEALFSVSADRSGQ